MQREISNKIQLGENLNLLRDISNVSSTDNVANLRDKFSKVDKLGNLRDKGKADTSLARYIPALTDVIRQGQVYSIVPEKAYAAQTYVDQKTLKVNVILAANTHTNYSSMCVVLPIQIMKRTDEKKNTDGTLITANNFFTNWLKEIDIKRYPDEVRVLTTNNAVDMYR